jgi:predicted nucleic acid-binding protein
MNNKRKQRQSGKRVELESKVLEAYNNRRKMFKNESVTESYTNIALKLDLNLYQVQYIILKARKDGKKVL